MQMRVIHAGNSHVTSLRAQDCVFNGSGRSGPVNKSNLPFRAVRALHPFFVHSTAPLHSLYSLFLPHKTGAANMSMAV